MVRLLRTVLVQLIVFLVVILTDTTSDGKSLIAQMKEWPFTKLRARLMKLKNKPARNKNDVARTVNPEAFMTSVQIINNRGYPVEVHTVVTEDGYILEVHRIPHGKGQSVDSTTPLGKPVFLQHGFTSSSSDWIISPTDRALAFRLADLGYDVWLGNVRGNVYSRKHTTLDPAGAAYWRFSWDEMGKYDIPAVINYVLAKTGRTKLIFIGHSMGCAIFFLAIITHPELNDKVEVMMAMAPATSLAHMRSPIRFAAPFVGPLELAFRLMQTRVFVTNDDLVPRLQARFCNPKDRHRTFFCRNIVFAFVDDDLQNIDEDLWPVMDGHTPSGTSLGTAVQFAQNYNSGEPFNPYDYGVIQNLRKYGRVDPVPYDLTKVTLPVYIFYGDNDLLVGPDDAKWLAEKLSNLKENVRVDLALYNHFDFLWATDNNRLLYDPLIARLPPAL